jgi:hypothetical protein
MLFSGQKLGQNNTGGGVFSGARLSDTILSRGNNRFEEELARKRGEEAINKLTKSKLEEALERERKSRTLLSAITDRNWKERAANSARAQATREYQGEGEMDEAVLNNINKTRESAYKIINDRSFANKSIDFVSGLGEGITEAYKRTGEGISELVYDWTGGNKREFEEYTKAQDERSKLLISLIEKRKKSTDEAEISRLNDAISSISKTYSDTFNSFQGRQSEIIERTDPVKNAAAIGEIGLDVITAGSFSGFGKAGVAGAKTFRLSRPAAKATGIAAKQIASQSAKNTLRKLPGIAGSSFMQGAVGNVTHQGSDATPESILKSGALTAAVATAVPIAGIGLKKIPGVTRSASKAVKKTTDKTINKVEEIMSGNRVGSKMLETKNKALSKVVDDLQNVYVKLRGHTDELGNSAVKETRRLKSNLSRASGKANSIISDDPNIKKMNDIFSNSSDKKRLYKEFIEYAKNRSSAYEAMKIGKNVEIPTGTKKVQELYSLLNKASKRQVKDLYEGGMISKSRFDNWMADTDWLRVQRQIEDSLPQGPQKGGKSLKTSITQQKIEGSTKEVVDPVASYIDWANRVYTEIEANKLNTYVTNQLDSLGKATKVVDAEDVTTRTLAKAQREQLKPLKTSLEKAIKSQKDYSKSISKEITQIKKSGRIELSKEIKRTMKDIFGDAEPGVMAQPDKYIDDTMKRISNIDNAKLSRLRKSLGNKETKLSQAMDELIEIKKQHLAAKDDMKALQNIIDSHKDKLYEPTKTIARWKNGIRELYETDPGVVSAINQTYDQSKNALTELMTKASTSVQRGSTLWNFAFAVPNVFKDYGHSLVVGDATLWSHINPINILASFKDSVIKPTYNIVGKRIGKTWKPTELYAKFLRDNTQGNRVDLIKQLKSSTKQAKRLVGAKGEGVVSKVENVISASENFGRFMNYRGKYKQLVSRGVTGEELFNKAAQAARENSVDFSIHGEYFHLAKAIDPYLNAGIQSSRSLARAFKERPVATTAKILAIGPIPTAMLTYHNLSDPNRARVYAEIPEWEKENNYVYVLSDGNVIKIPASPSITGYNKPIRNMIEAEYISDRQSFTETAKNIFIDPFNPLSKGSLVPTAIKAPIEIATNKNLYTGKELIPENMKDLPPEEQVFRTTPQTYRDIGKIFNISPIYIDKLVKGYTSSTGEQVVAGVEKVREVTGTGGIDTGRDTMSQVAGRFFIPKDSYKLNAVVSKFYEDYSKIQSEGKVSSRKATEAVKAGNTQKALQIIIEHNKKVDEQADKFKTKYGRYSSDQSELLKTLEKTKIQ